MFFLALPANVAAYVLTWAWVKDLCKVLSILHRKSTNFLHYTNMELCLESLLGERCVCVKIGHTNGNNWKALFIILDTFPLLFLLYKYTRRAGSSQINIRVYAFSLSQHDRLIYMTYLFFKPLTWLRRRRINVCNKPIYFIVLFLYLNLHSSERKRQFVLIKIKSRYHLRGLKWIADVMYHTVELSVPEPMLHQ